MPSYGMPTDRDDVRLAVVAASELLSDCYVYRCSVCGLVLLESGPLFKLVLHRDCGGQWRAVVQPLARAVVLHFLTRQMLSGGPRWEKV